MNKFNEIYNKIISENTFDEIKWSSPEIAECMKKITEKLENHGFILLIDSYGYQLRNAKFAKEGDYKEWIIGSFLNAYSKKEESIKMREVKSIHFGEVYKHNGAKANASIDCYVIYNGEEKPPEWYYIKPGGWFPRKKTECKQIDIRRFKPSISDKLMDKMIAEAIAAYDSINLKDWSDVKMEPPTEEK